MRWHTPHLGRSLGWRASVDDETLAALLATLHEGVFEIPLWSTFLNRLRDATGAEYATLIFEPPGRPHDSLSMLSGGEPPSVVKNFYRAFGPSERPTSPVVEGRIYTLTELVSDARAAETGFFREIEITHGMRAIRVVRLEEVTGVNAWLSIARREPDFGSDAEAILRALVPAVRGVLRLYVAMERERFAASLTAEAVRRLQFGWLSLDGAGRVLDSDAQGAFVLAQSGVLTRNASDQLSAKPAKLERQILSTIARMTKNPRSRPCAIRLSQDPWLDMLLLPARSTSIAASGAPAVIAYVHGDNWHATDRCDQLAELFALSRSEARMALALSRGMTIAEAASSFNLTLESARTYSKLIYAKTGARGLPDLVRIVMRSVLAIAPDS